jgi:hypothetical protein
MNREDFELMYITRHLNYLPFVEASSHVVNLRNGDQYHRHTDDGHLDDSYYWFMKGLDHAA